MADSQNAELSGTSEDLEAAGDTEQRFHTLAVLVRLIGELVKQPGRKKKGGWMS